ncbi:lysine exporter LysO family protein [Erwinia pyrifoliae]|uniref:Lysine exporter LysO family protein n=1 Tax=Erwinia pyrifoliae TaxID=79967 RepID=A0ABY5XBZ0_ERWPY|nr:lysine exporter LysO family protein [Erwinia pyrifoliae]UWS34916.1 lysine exporter LysO family protein [Erwinia pyrifoliae]
MKESLLSVIVVVLLLSSGYFSGKKLKARIRNILLSKIGLVVLLLLFCMGIDFGAVFSNREIGAEIVKSALVLATILSVSTFIILVRKRGGAYSHSEPTNFSGPVIGCIKAILSFAVGVMLYRFTHFSLQDIHFSSNYILYGLIYLVGMDLVNFRIATVRSEIFLLPALVIAANLISVLVFSSVSNYSFAESLVVSSGFGWFSLSGPMVNILVSPKMGAMAFMTDFFREMLSIFVLYFLGKKQPRSAIGISGAAALDSALPFIKENCHEEFIQHAIVSGFILTLLAPIFISLTVGLL